MDTATAISQPKTSQQLPGPDALLSQRQMVVLLLLIVCLAGFLRFYQLSYPSVWIDELNHYYAAQTYIENGKMTLPSGEPNERAFLYSAFVSYAFRVFGANAFALRFPSALFGVLCVVLAAFIARRFFGRTTAVLTALFVAISPFAIGWSRLSRFYTLFQFLFMAAVYLFYLGFESTNTGRMAALQRRALTAIGAGRLQALLENWHVNLIRILLSLPIFAVSYTVQPLTALFAIGLLLYCGLMVLLTWQQESLRCALFGKYSLCLLLILVAGTLSVLFLAPVRETALHALTYTPKWAEGTRFQQRSLYLNFLFDHFQFPMGVLFVIGAYQIFARQHRQGLYAFALFAGPLVMFIAVFSFRHFQYIFNVYSFFTMMAAFAFANIIAAELPAVRARWFAGSKLSAAAVSGIVFLAFLLWLPAAPAVRLAKNIPTQGDGKFNGAMFLEEWREAAGFVKKQLAQQDLVISSDALGTLYYLGRVDYDLNFADLDIAKFEHLVDANGRYFDLYSGAPFVESRTQLDSLLQSQGRTWLLFQRYKLMDAPAYTPPPLRDYILSTCKKVYTTPNGTVQVYVHEGENTAAPLAAGSAAGTGGAAGRRRR